MRTRGPHRYAPEALVSKRLLEALIRFANGDSLGEVANSGVFKDIRGYPVLHVFSLPPIDSRRERKVREQARLWLKLASIDLDMLEARMSGVAIPAVSVSPERTLKGTRRRPQGGPGWLVPIVRGAHQWPIAVMAVALLTPVGERDQDVLANRVGMCDCCQVFYLKKISVKGGCCSAKCRRMMAA